MPPAPGLIALRCLLTFGGTNIVKFCCPNSSLTILAGLVPPLFHLRRPWVDPGYLEAQDRAPFSDLLPPCTKTCAFLFTLVSRRCLPMILGIESGPIFMTFVVPETGWEFDDYSALLTLRHPPILSTRLVDCEVIGPQA